MKLSSLVPGFPARLRYSLTPGKMTANFEQMDGDGEPDLGPGFQPAEAAGGIPGLGDQLASETTLDQLFAANGTAQKGPDLNFIFGNEGFRLKGYVPNPKHSQSGVTVASGVDLGQRNRADILGLDIPKSLKKKLLPYAGLKKQAAVNYLKKHPLKLSAKEAKSLDDAVQKQLLDRVTKNYDQTDPPVKFEDLPGEAQTAIGDVAYQYGPNLGSRAATEDFWDDATAGNWSAAVEDLRGMSQYTGRRSADADLLDQAIDRGTLNAGD